MNQYTKPLPVIDDRNRPFWEGARAGELRVQQCLDCSRMRHPPGPLCPDCHSVSTDWVRLSGKGVVWSRCIFHRPYFPSFSADLPYAVVLVQLDEGPKLYSNLVDVANSQIRIGMPVEAYFEPVTDEVTLIKFRAATQRTIAGGE